MKRSSTILVVFAFGVFLSACDGGDFDASDVREIVEALQELEAESAGDAAGSGGSGSSGGSGDSGGSGSSGDSGDSEDSEGSSSLGANTDSPNRPPVPSGGSQEHSLYWEGLGSSVEEWDFSPIEQSHDDVIDHYEDYFGSEGRSATSSDGNPMTSWNTPEQQVIVRDNGFSTEVTTRYRD